MTTPLETSDNDDEPENEDTETGTGNEIPTGSDVDEEFPERGGDEDDITEEVLPQHKQEITSNGETRTQAPASPKRLCCTECTD